MGSASSVEARTPALDDWVARARAPRARVASAWGPVAQSERAEPPLLGLTRCTRSYSKGGGGADGGWSGSAGWWCSETAGEQNHLCACGATYCDTGIKAISDAQLV
jgi:hypothetical protein